MNIKQKLAQLEDELMELKKQVYDKPVFEGKGLEMVDFEDCKSPFQIAKFTVTELLWAEVTQDKLAESSKADLPKTNVSWNDAQDFIRKLNEITGKAYRLPTEAEWMLAAMVDNTVYSGSDDINEVAWYSKNSNDQTHPVGLKKPNSLGIYDMSGNVWEWCQDWWYKDKNKVIRGGSWADNPAGVRCSYRSIFTPDDRSHDLGFRLARTV